MTLLNSPYTPLLAVRSEFDPTESKIRSFRLFQKGWHYGQGLPFTEAAINDALLLHRQLFFKGFGKTDAFPGPNGEIQVTVYHDDHYFQFEREPGGLWSITYEKNDAEIEFISGQSFDQVLHYLNALDAKVCDTSDVYIEGIGIKPGSGLMIWPSRPLAMGFQSLKQNVRLAQARQFAAT